MEALLTYAINTCLRKFIKSAAGRTGSNLRVALSGGSVILKHLELNLRPFLKNLPVIVQRAFVQQLSITLPWTSLSLAQIQVRLDTVEIVLALQEDGDEVKDATEGDGLQGDGADSAADASNSWLGSWQSYLHSLLCNLTIQVNNMVVKLKSRSAVTTLTLQNLTIVSVKDSWIDAMKEPEKWIKKMVDLNQLTMTLEELGPDGAVVHFPEPLVKTPKLQATVIAPALSMLAGELPAHDEYCVRLSLDVHPIKGTVSNLQIGWLNSLMKELSEAMEKVQPLDTGQQLAVVEAEPKPPDPEVTMPTPQQQPLPSSWFSAFTQEWETWLTEPQDTSPKLTTSFLAPAAKDLPMPSVQATATFQGADITLSTAHPYLTHHRRSSSTTLAVPQLPPLPLDPSGHPSLRPSAPPSTPFSWSSPRTSHSCTQTRENSPAPPLSHRNSRSLNNLTTSSSPAPTIPQRSTDSHYTARTPHVPSLPDASLHPASTLFNHSISDPKSCAQEDSNPDPTQSWHLPTTDTSSLSSSRPGTPGRLSTKYSIPPSPPLPSIPSITPNGPPFSIRGRQSSAGSEVAPLLWLPSPVDSSFSVQFQGSSGASDVQVLRACAVDGRTVSRTVSMGSMTESETQDSIGTGAYHVRKHSGEDLELSLALSTSLELSVHVPDEPSARKARRSYKLCTLLQFKWTMLQVSAHILGDKTLSAWSLQLNHMCLLRAVVDQLPQPDATATDTSRHPTIAPRPTPADSKPTHQPSVPLESATFDASTASTPLLPKPAQHSHMGPHHADSAHMPPRAPTLSGQRVSARDTAPTQLNTPGGKASRMDCILSLGRLQGDGANDGVPGVDMRLRWESREEVRTSGSWRGAGKTASTVDEAPVLSCKIAYLHVLYPIGAVELLRRFTASCTASTATDPDGQNTQTIDNAVDSSTQRDDSSGSASQAERDELSGRTSTPGDAATKQGEQTGGADDSTHSGEEPEEGRNKWNLRSLLRGKKLAWDLVAESVTFGGLSCCGADAEAVLLSFEHIKAASKAPLMQQRPPEGLLPGLLRYRQSLPTDVAFHAQMSGVSVQMANIWVPTAAWKGVVAQDGVQAVSNTMHTALVATRAIDPTTGTKGPLNISFATSALDLRFTAVQFSALVAWMIDIIVEALARFQLPLLQRMFTASQLKDLRAVPWLNAVMVEASGGFQLHIPPNDTGQPENCSSDVQSGHAVQGGNVIGSGGVMKSEGAVQDARGVQNMATLQGERFTDPVACKKAESTAVEGFSIATGANARTTGSTIGGTAGSTIGGTTGSTLGGANTDASLGVSCKSGSESESLERSISEEQHQKAAVVLCGSGVSLILAGHACSAVHPPTGSTISDGQQYFPALCVAADDMAVDLYPVVMVRAPRLKLHTVEVMLPIEGAVAYQWSDSPGESTASLSPHLAKYSPPAETTSQPGSPPPGLNGTAHGTTNGTAHGTTHGTANSAVHGTAHSTAPGTANSAVHDTTNGTTIGTTSGTTHGATSATTIGATICTTNGTAIDSTAGTGPSYYTSQGSQYMLSGSTAAGLPGSKAGTTVHSALGSELDMWQLTVHGVGEFGTVKDFTFFRSTSTYPGMPVPADGATRLPQDLPLPPGAPTTYAKKYVIAASHAALQLQPKQVAVLLQLSKSMSTGPMFAVIPYIPCTSTAMFDTSRYSLDCPDVVLTILPTDTDHVSGSNPNLTQSHLPFVGTTDSRVDTGPSVEAHADSARADSGSSPHLTQSHLPFGGTTDSRYSEGPNAAGPAESARPDSLTLRVSEFMMVYKTTNLWQPVSSAECMEVLAYESTGLSTLWNFSAQDVQAWADVEKSAGGSRTTGAAGSRQNLLVGTFDSKGDQSLTAAKKTKVQAVIQYGGLLSTFIESRCSLGHVKLWVAPELIPLMKALSKMADAVETPLVVPGALSRKPPTPPTDRSSTSLTASSLCLTATAAGTDSGDLVSGADRVFGDQSKPGVHGFCGEVHMHDMCHSLIVACTDLAYISHDSPVSGERKDAAAGDKPQRSVVVAAGVSVMTQQAVNGTISNTNMVLLPTHVQLVTHTTPTALSSINTPSKTTTLRLPSLQLQLSLSALHCTMQMTQAFQAFLKTPTPTPAAATEEGSDPVSAASTTQHSATGTQDIEPLHHDDDDDMETSSTSAQQLPKTSTCIGVQVDSWRVALMRDALQQACPMPGRKQGDGDSVWCFAPVDELVVLSGGQLLAGMQDWGQGHRSARLALASLNVCAVERACVAHYTVFQLQNMVFDYTAASRTSMHLMNDLGSTGTTSEEEDGIVLGSSGSLEDLLASLQPPTAAGVQVNIQVPDNPIRLHLHEMGAEALIQAATYGRSAAAVASSIMSGTPVTHEAEDALSLRALSPVGVHNTCPMAFCVRQEGCSNVVVVSGGSTVSFLWMEAPGVKQQAVRKVQVARWLEGVGTAGELKWSEAVEVPIMAAHHLMVPWSDGSSARIALTVSRGPLHRYLVTIRTGLLLVNRTRLPLSLYLSGVLLGTHNSEPIEGQEEGAAFTSSPGNRSLGLHQNQAMKLSSTTQSQSVVVNQASSPDNYSCVVTIGAAVSAQQSPCEIPLLPLVNALDSQNGVGTSNFAQVLMEGSQWSRPIPLSSTMYKAGNVEPAPTSAPTPPVHLKAVDHISPGKEVLHFSVGLPNPVTGQAMLEFLPSYRLRNLLPVPVAFGVQQLERDGGVRRRGEGCLLTQPQVAELDPGAQASLTMHTSQPSLLHLHVRTPATEWHSFQPSSDSHHSTTLSSPFSSQHENTTTPRVSIDQTAPTAPHPHTTPTRLPANPTTPTPPTLFTSTSSTDNAPFGASDNASIAAASTDSANPPSPTTPNAATANRVDTCRVLCTMPDSPSSVGTSPDYEPHQRPRDSGNCVPSLASLQRTSSNAAAALLSSRQCSPSFSLSHSLPSNTPLGSTTYSTTFSSSVSGPWLLAGGTSTSGRSELRSLQVLPAPGTKVGVALEQRARKRHKANPTSLISGDDPRQQTTDIMETKSAGTSMYGSEPALDTTYSRSSVRVLDAKMKDMPQDMVETERVLMVSERAEQESSASQLEVSAVVMPDAGGSGAAEVVLLPNGVVVNGTAMPLYVEIVEPGAHAPTFSKASSSCPLNMPGYNPNRTYKAIIKALLPLPNASPSVTSQPPSPHSNQWLELSSSKLLLSPGSTNLVALLSTHRTNSPAPHALWAGAACVAITVDIITWTPPATPTPPQHPSKTPNIQPHQILRVTVSPPLTVVNLSSLPVNLNLQGVMDSSSSGAFCSSSPVPCMPGTATPVLLSDVSLLKQARQPAGTARSAAATPRRPVQATSPPEAAGTVSLRLQMSHSHLLSAASSTVLTTTQHQPSTRSTSSKSRTNTTSNSRTNTHSSRRSETSGPGCDGASTVCAVHRADSACTAESYVPCMCGQVSISIPGYTRGRLCSQEGKIDDASSPLDAQGTAGSTTVYNNSCGSTYDNSVMYRLAVVDGHHTLLLWSDSQPSLLLRNTLSVELEVAHCKAGPPHAAHTVMQRADKGVRMCKVFPLAPGAQLPVYADDLFESKTDPDIAAVEGDDMDDGSLLVERMGGQAPSSGFDPCILCVRFKGSSEWFSPFECEPGLHRFGPLSSRVVLVGPTTHITFLPKISSSRSSPEFPSSPASQQLLPHPKRFHFFCRSLQVSLWDKDVHHDIRATSDPVSPSISPKEMLCLTLDNVTTSLQTEHKPLPSHTAFPSGTSIKSTTLAVVVQDIQCDAYLTAQSGSVVATTRHESRRVVTSKSTKTGTEKQSDGFLLNLEWTQVTTPCLSSGSTDEAVGELQLATSAVQLSSHSSRGSEKGKRKVTLASAPAHRAPGLKSEAEAYSMSHGSAGAHVADWTDVGQPADLPQAGSKRHVGMDTGSSFDTSSSTRSARPTTDGAACVVCEWVESVQVQVPVVVVVLDDSLLLFGTQTMKLYLDLLKGMGPSAQSELDQDASTIMRERAAVMEAGSPQSSMQVIDDARANTHAQHATVHAQHATSNAQHTTIHAQHATIQAQHTTTQAHHVATRTQLSQGNDIVGGNMNTETTCEESVLGATSTGRLTASRIGTTAPESSGAWIEVTTPEEALRLFERRLMLAAATLCGSPLFLRRASCSDIRLLLDLHLAEGGGVLPISLDTNRSPFTLNPVRLEHIRVPWPVMTQALSAHYMAEGLMNVPQVLGSFELLFNLTGLVGSVTQGVWDLVALPLAGLEERSAAAFLTAIFRGSASLPYYLSRWTLTSISGFSSAFAKLLRTSISQKRSQLPHPATSVASTYRQPESFLSISSIASSVGRGMLGMISYPLSGALDVVSAVSGGLATSTGITAVLRPLRPALPPGYIPAAASAGAQLGMLRSTPLHGACLGSFEADVTIIELRHHTSNTHTTTTPHPPATFTAASQPSSPESSGQRGCSEHLDQECDQSRSHSHRRDHLDPNGDRMDHRGRNDNPRNLNSDLRNLSTDPSNLNTDPRNLNGDPRNLNGDPRNLNGDLRNLNGDPRNLNGGQRDHLNLDGENVSQEQVVRDVTVLVTTAGVMLCRPGCSIPWLVMPLSALSSRMVSIGPVVRFSHPAAWVKLAGDCAVPEQWVWVSRNEKHGISGTCTAAKCTAAKCTAADCSAANCSAAICGGASCAARSCGSHDKQAAGGVDTVSVAMQDGVLTGTDVSRISDGKSAARRALHDGQVAVRCSVCGASCAADSTTTSQRESNAVGHAAAVAGKAEGGHSSDGVQTTRMVWQRVGSQHTCSDSNSDRNSSSNSDSRSGSSGTNKGSLSWLSRGVSLFTTSHDESSAASTGAAANAAATVKNTDQVDHVPSSSNGPSRQHHDHHHHHHHNDHHQQQPSSAGAGSRGQTNSAKNVGSFGSDVSAVTGCWHVPQYQQPVCQSCRSIAGCRAPAGYVPAAVVVQVTARDPPDWDLTSALDLCSILK